MYTCRANSPANASGDRDGFPQAYTHPGPLTR